MEARRRRPGRPARFRPRVAVLLPRMALYPASMQFRTTFEQAGRVAGLAGDLDVSEAEVIRRLMTWALDGKNVGARLRKELAAEERANVRRSRALERELGLDVGDLAPVDEREQDPR